MAGLVLNFLIDGPRCFFDGRARVLATVARKTGRLAPPIAVAIPSNLEISAARQTLPLRRGFLVSSAELRSGTKSPAGRCVREVESMLIVVGLRAETGVRGFEKKRPGRHLPWRRIPLPTWRHLLTRQAR